MAEKEIRCPVVRFFLVMYLFSPFFYFQLVIFFFHVF